MDSKGAKDDFDFGIDAKGITSPSNQRGMNNNSAESKSGSDDLYYGDDSKGLPETNDTKELPVINVLSVDIGNDGKEEDISSSIELKITFELDRDVVAGYWCIKFLVDSCDSRIIKILGETEVEDYPEGESDVYYTCDSIDFSGISPSALTNSGLLIASFMGNGQEIACVNCVVNVQKNASCQLMREILSPLG